MVVMKIQYGNIQKIATQANISRTYLSMILSGVRRPTYEIARRLARATDTDAVLWLSGMPGELRQAVVATCERIARKAAYNAALGNNVEDDIDF